jgi:hypothetical protein
MFHTLICSIFLFFRVFFFTSFPLHFYLYSRTHNFTYLSYPLSLFLPKSLSLSVLLSTHSFTSVTGNISVLEDLPCLQVLDLASTAVEGDIKSLSKCVHLTDVSFWGTSKVRKKMMTTKTCCCLNYQIYIYICIYVCVCMYVYMVLH